MHKTLMTGFLLVTIKTADPIANAAMNKKKTRYQFIDTPSSAVSNELSAD